MTSNKPDLSPKYLASQLVDLHVQYELRNFEATQFIKWVGEDIEQVLNWLKNQTLEDLVDAVQVKSTILETVVNQSIPGAITEIAGDTALKHFNSEWHLETQLKHVMSARQFEGFIIKLLELKNQRNKLIDHITELPVYKELISGILYGAITRYIYDSNLVSANIPGVSSMLKISRNMVNKAAPKLSGAVEANVRSFIENNLDLVKNESKTFLNRAMDEDDMLSSIMDFWDAAEDCTMAEFQEGMEALDLADLVVLGYEFWLNFRQTTYFKNSYETIIDHWFEKYGQNKLADLIDDLDLSKDMLINEAQRYAPKLLKKLRDTGELEDLIRSRLEGFYESQQSIDFFTQMTNQLLESQS